MARDLPIREVTEDWLHTYLAAILARYGETDQRSVTKPRGWFAEAFAETTKEGGRDNTLTSLAGRLLNALPDYDAIAILNLWAEERCVPPLSEKDVLRVVGSLSRKRRFDNEVHSAKQTAFEPDQIDRPPTAGPEDDFYRSL